MLFLYHKNQRIFKDRKWDILKQHTTDKIEIQSLGKGGLGVQQPGSKRKITNMNIL